ncbi:metal ABC transporter permease [Actinoallomurus acaciae]|uniref:Metal ABC transporter permease n=1 Tax=Actinoallomurus acaciae TaxID=502577 RepID=A0ABV5YD18_9ACTN
MTGFGVRATVESIFTGAACGSLGVQVVLRRLAFFTETLGHVAFLGIVAATIVGSDIKAGAAVATAGAVALAGRGGIASGQPGLRSGVLVSGALALGVVLISTRQGFSKDLTAALVGSPLTVTTGDIIAAGIVAACVAALLTAVHKELLLAAFDPHATRAFGYPARLIDMGLLSLLAVTVVTAAPAVGATLPLALLVGPPATALLWTRRVVPATVLGGLLAAGTAAAGLVLSLHYRLAASAAGAILCGALFLITLAARLGHRMTVLTRRQAAEPV